METVKLVGVVGADSALGLPDFRAAERSFALIAQVCGRSGRARHGEAIVQTFQPGYVFHGRVLRPAMVRVAVQATPASKKTVN